MLNVYIMDACMKWRRNKAFFLSSFNIFVVLWVGLNGPGPTHFYNWPILNDRVIIELFFRIKINI